ncbi:MAG: YadA-like family protein, partial [Fusobacterium sp.]|nr:YadA-like family protein [Fusobacterium sp.]
TSIDAYTKTESDNKFAEKSNVYNKTESDNRYLDKTAYNKDKGTFATKTELNTKADKKDLDKKTNIDASNIDPTVWKNKLGLAGSAADLAPVNNKINSLEKIVNDNKKEMRGIGALSASLAALHPMQYDPYAPNQIMAGLGTYKDKQAISLGVAHYFKENIMMTAGIALSNENKTDAMANLGLTWKIGKAGETRVEPSQTVIQSEISRLARENQDLKKELSTIKEQLKELLNSK